MSALWQDVRQGFRLLRKNPGFSIVLLGTLSMAIGVNTTMFSLVDAVLFRPLRVERADELYRLLPETTVGMGWSWPMFDALRDAPDTGMRIAASSDAMPVHVAPAGGRPMRALAMLTSDNFLEVVGARLLLGRGLPPDDGRPGAEPMVVIGHRLWTESFAADPEVVGRTLRINGSPYVIAGVTPPGFGGASLESFPDLWIPLAHVESVRPDLAVFKPRTRSGFGWLNLVARLRDGVTEAQAKARLDGIVTRPVGEGRGPEIKGAALVRAVDVALGVDGPSASRARTAARMLYGVVLLILAIACSNAAGLLLVRGDRRAREMAIRRAVGASRARIVRQLLVENLVLGAFAAVGGLLLSAWTLDVARALVPAGSLLPLEAAGHIGDWRVLAYTLVVAFATTLLFSLVPALRASRGDLVSVMKGEPADRRDAGRRPALREALVGFEVAMAAVLLAGAGMLLRTLLQIGAVDPGFEVDRRVTASLDLAPQGYDEARAAVFYDRLLEGARALPGVRAAALGHTVPVQASRMFNSVEYEGYEGDPDQAPLVAFDIVTPGYFRTLGISVLRGRDFDRSDGAGAPPVVIVNQAFARRYWDGREAIGRRIMNLGEHGGVVVGVVKDARMSSLRNAAEPMLFLPLTQFRMQAMSVVAETEADPDAVLPAIAGLVERLDADLPVYGLETLRRRLGVAAGQERLLARLLAIFSGVALALAACGLYGVTAQATEARTREFGIRMALGARRRHVLGLVLGRVSVLVLAGASAGMAGAVALARSFQSLLYGVGRADPASIAVSVAVLGAVALLACALPARRATRIDPIAALRCD